MYVYDVSFCSFFLFSLTIILLCSNQSVSLLGNVLSQSPAVSLSPITARFPLQTDFSFLPSTVL